MWVLGIIGDRFRSNAICVSRLGANGHSCQLMEVQQELQPPEAPLLFQDLQEDNQGLLGDGIVILHQRQQQRAVIAWQEAQAAEFPANIAKND